MLVLDILSRGKVSLQAISYSQSRRDINLSLKWCVEDEWGEETALLPHFARRKCAFPVISSLRHSIQTLKNKLAHVTSLLETLKWLPFALRKKIRTPYHDWQGPP